jgi:hypothetical protein
MLPESLKQIIYSYVRDVNSIKNKNINEEMKDNIRLCIHCNKYKLIQKTCIVCYSDCCISCMYSFDKIYEINDHFSQSTVKWIVKKKNELCRDCCTTWFVETFFDGFYPDDYQLNI